MNLLQKRSSGYFFYILKFHCLQKNFHVILEQLVSGHINFSTHEPPLSVSQVCTSALPTKYKQVCLRNIMRSNPRQWRRVGDESVINSLMESEKQARKQLDSKDYRRHTEHLSFDFLGSHQYKKSYL